MYIDLGLEFGIVCGGVVCSRNVVDYKVGGDVEDVGGVDCYEECCV